MYKVVYTEQEKNLHDATKKVEKEVNELKKQGWIEQGGVSITSTKYYEAIWYSVAQAMVKDE